MTFLTGILAEQLPWIIGLVMVAVGALGWRWNDKRKLRQQGAEQRETELKKGWDTHAGKVEAAVREARDGGVDAARERLHRAARGDRAGNSGPMQSANDRAPDQR